MHTRLSIYDKKGEEFYNVAFKDGNFAANCVFYDTAYRAPNNSFKLFVHLAKRGKFKRTYNPATSLTP
eukprot:scaffold282078_cov19-Prasinocladus_malaysianus.AAC.1